MKTRGNEIFGAFPERAETKLYPALPPKRVPFRVDVEQEVVRDYTQINKLMGNTITILQSQNDIFKSRVEDLVGDIKQSRGDILELRQKIEKARQLDGITSTESQTLCDADIANLTVDSTVEVLKNKPIIIDLFLDHIQPDALISTLSALDFSVREAFVGYSVAQLDRLVACIDGYRRVYNHVNTLQFSSVLTKLAEQVFGSDMAYLFLRNRSTDEYVTELPGKGVGISLKVGDSSITGVIQSQTCCVYTDPQTAPCYTPSIDLLFNPQKYPVLLIPISVDGVIAVMHTDKSCFTFSNEDLSVGKFFSSLFSELVESHVGYMAAKKEMHMKLRFRKFEHELFAMDQLETLVPFLDRQLNKWVKVSEVKLFLLRDDFLVLQLSGRKLVEVKYDLSCLAGKVLKGGEPFVVERLSEEETGWDLDKKTDGWALGQPFAGFPIMESCERAGGVLCVSGVKPFNHSSIEFLTAVAAALSVIIPHCIQGAHRKSACEAQSMIAALPKLIESVHSEQLESSDGIGELAKAASEHLKSSFLSIYKRCDGVMRLIASVDNGELTSDNFVTNEFVGYVFEHRETICETDCHRVPHFSTVDPKLRVNSVLSVPMVVDENCIFAVIALNLKGISGDFASRYSVFLSVILNLVMCSEKLIEKKKDVEEEKLFQSVNQEVLSLLKRALEPESDQFSSFLEAFLKEMTDKFEMRHFAVLKHSSLEKGYMILVKSFTCEAKSISENDKLMKEIASHDDIFETNVDGQMKSWCEDSRHLLCVPLTGNSFCLFFGENSIQDQLPHMRYYKTVLSTLYKNFSLSRVGHFALMKNAMKTVDAFHTKLTDEMVSSRLFSVTMLTDNEKIESIILMFAKFKLLDLLEVNYDAFAKFLVEVKDNYLNVPYHNWDHAVDTTQFVYSCLVRANLENFFQQTHIAALLLASLLHDIGHKALNSLFHINSKSPLWRVYGDESPLEKHHLAIGTKLLRDRLITKDKKLSTDTTFWKFFSASILSTDMMKHFDYMEQFETLEVRDGSSEENLIILAQLLIKCGNAANTTRPFDVAKPMAEHLLDEYLAQGLREEELGIPVTGLAEAVHRHQQSLPKIEVEFMTTLVLPMLKALGRVLPDLSDFAVQMNDNKRQWEMIS